MGKSSSKDTAFARGPWWHAPIPYHLGFVLVVVVLLLDANRDPKILERLKLHASAAPTQRPTSPEKRLFFAVAEIGGSAECSLDGHDWAEVVVGRQIAAGSFVRSTSGARLKLKATDGRSLTFQGQWAFRVCAFSVGNWPPRLFHRSCSRLIEPPSGNFSHESSVGVTYGKDDGSDVLQHYRALLATLHRAGESIALPTFALCVPPRRVDLIDDSLLRLVTAPADTLYPDSLHNAVDRRADPLCR